MQTTPTWYDAHLSHFRHRPYVTGQEGYRELYRYSIEDGDRFWSEQAREYLTWEREWDSVLHHDPDAARVEWFGGGVLNASVNCLDRHLGCLAHHVAFHCEAEEPLGSRAVTYGELHALVNRLAALLRTRGIEKGDRVVIYLPAVVELPAAMLACARIGAVHCAISVELSGAYLGNRIRDVSPRVVITADSMNRAGVSVSLKARVDHALVDNSAVETVLIFDRMRSAVDRLDGRDILWSQVRDDPTLPRTCDPVPMSAEDPLFIIFAAGTAGRPRPLVHTTAGYLLWAAMTTRLVLDVRPDDVVWCTSDPSRVGGHAFSVYGTLLNGVTGVLFDGSLLPSGLDRIWSVVSGRRVTRLSIDSHLVSALCVSGAVPGEEHDLSSLEVIGTTGEPLPPDVWEWLYHRVGRDRLPVLSMWFQTESGGPIMTPLPGVAPLRSGSVSGPFLGIQPLILDLNTGNVVRFPNQEGVFCIEKPWPGMVRTIFGDHDTYREAYCEPFQGIFITGEGAKRDDDGQYWMTGRMDDVLKVTGFRIGAWEIETVLVSHNQVTEAVVVGFPHLWKGRGVYAFVTLAPGVLGDDMLKEELSRFLEHHIGSMVIPDVIQWACGLPKTRSGKILRRLLQKIASGQVDDLGDLSTVANPAAVEALVRDRSGVRVSCG